MTFEEEINKLKMSRTLDLLGKFAQTKFVDYSNKESVNACLLAAVLPIIHALDNGDLVCVKGKEEGMAYLLGLLVICLEIAENGKFKDMFTTVKAN